MKLYKHQKRILDEFPHKSLLIWGTGSGKTLTGIKLAEKSGEYTLFISPKALKENWRENIEEHFNDGKYELVTKEEFRKSWDDLDKYNTIVLDEIHHFFGMKSQMMKALMKYLKKHDPEYVWGLTATPYRSSPWDIFKAYEIMGKKLNYRMFDQKFFFNICLGVWMKGGSVIPSWVPGAFCKGRTVPKAKNGIEEEIARMVKEIGDVVRLDECFDVPEQVYEPTFFQLTSSQITAIKNIDDVLPIVKFTKEHQICGGTLKGDEYVEDQTYKSDKLDRLIEVVDENDKSIVVCKYNNEIKYLEEKLKGIKDIYIINGAVKDRHAVLQKAREHDKYCIIANAACAEGWEVPECPLMIFYSMSYQLLHYTQMMGRIQRANNIKKNIYLFFIVKDSIDEAVYKTIMAKKDFDIEIYSKTL